jgi:hypothetical protein
MPPRTPQIRKDNLQIYHATASVSNLKDNLYVMPKTSAKQIGKNNYNNLH